MAQVKDVQVQAVVAGTHFTVKHSKGELKLTVLPGSGPNTIDLSDEGEMIFVDLTSKTQVARREKLAETRALGLHVADLCFFSDLAKKYGAVIRCLGCGTPVRKWTSDLHQSHTCDSCGVKAKRAKSKAKRAAKSSEAKSEIKAS